MGHFLTYSQIYVLNVNQLLVHCLIALIQQFWISVNQQLHKFFKRPLHLRYARTCLLGLNDELPTDFL